MRSIKSVQPKPVSFSICHIRKIIFATIFEWYRYFFYPSVFSKFRRQFGGAARNIQCKKRLRCIFRGADVDETFKLERLLVGLGRLRLNVIDVEIKNRGSGPVPCSAGAIVEDEFQWPVDFLTKVNAISLFTIHNVVYGNNIQAIWKYLLRSPNANSWIGRKFEKALAKAGQRGIGRMYRHILPCESEWKERPLR